MNCAGTYADNVKLFINKLISIKAGLIVFLVFASLIYLFKFKSESSETLLHDTEGKWKVAKYSFISGIFGVISMIFIKLSRQQSVFTGENIKHYLLLIFILALFEFSKEGSGYNRYMDKDNIVNHTGTYYDIDTVHMSPLEIKKTLDCEEKGGDPFLLASSYILIFVIIATVGFKAASMLNIALCNSVKNSISSIKSVISSSGTISFTVETLAIILLNMIPAVITNRLRGETHSGLASLATPVGGGLLHLMSQWVGLYA